MYMLPHIWRLPKIGLPQIYHHPTHWSMAQAMAWRVPMFPETFIYIYIMSCHVMYVYVCNVMKCNVV